LEALLDELGITDLRDEEYATLVTTDLFVRGVGACGSSHTTWRARGPGVA
jgi:hypothetical protein